MSAGKQQVKALHRKEISGSGGGRKRRREVYKANSQDVVNRKRKLLNLIKRGLKLEQLANVAQLEAALKRLHI